MSRAKSHRPVRGPSASTEHYLRAILELREERGYARAVDIAARVGVTKGTVSLTLGQLAERGLVKFDDARFPFLTLAGHRLAADVRGRYTIVHAFLTEVLGLPPERASAEACRWEHAVSHAVADRILDLVQFSADSPALSRALEPFKKFHRRCRSEARCATCAVGGPVESYCAIVEPTRSPNRGS